MQDPDEARIRQTVDTAMTPFDHQLDRLLDAYDAGIDRLDGAVTALRAQLDQFDAAQADINRQGIAETREAMNEARCSRRVPAWTLRAGDQVNLGESHGWLDTTYARVALIIRSLPGWLVELHFGDGTSATIAPDTGVRIRTVG